MSKTWCWSDGTEPEPGTAGAGRARRRAWLLALTVVVATGGAATRQAVGGGVVEHRAASADQADEFLSPVVFVVGFPSYGRPLRDYATMTRDLIADLERATAYHGYNDPDAPPYLRYRLYDDRVFVDDVPPRVLANGNADYADIFARYDLCDLVSGAAVDEVWFIVAGDGNGATLGHMPEWVTSGLGWSTSRFYGTTMSVDMPDCGRVVTTMMFHYGLDLGFALHSFAHRAEGFFMTHVPCEFITESWPWRGRASAWLDGCPDVDRDRYAFVGRAGAANGGVAACGDVHTPPNRTSDEPYVYSDRSVEASMCADWSMDGSARVASVDCTTWGCSQHGYMTWWMQNVPGLDNTNRDPFGQPMANWWPLLFHGPPVETMPTSTAGPAPVPRLLFQDRFDGDRDPRWSDWQGGTGVPRWRVVDGVLDVAALDAEAISFVDGLVCSDCSVEAKVQVAADGGPQDERAIGLVLRVRAPGDLYLAHVRLAKASGGDTQPSVSMWRRRDGGWGCMGERRYDVQPGREMRLRFAARGEWLTFSIDDEIVVQARERSAPRAGSAGVRASQALGRIDDFAVWGLDHLRLTPTATPGAGTTTAPSATPGAGTAIAPTVTPSPSRTPAATGGRVYMPVALRPVEPPRTLEVEFLGQDGGAYVGPECSREAAPDDIHIRVRLPREHGFPIGFSVADPGGRGLWVSPCNGTNWWLWPVGDPWDRARWDLYLEPHRMAPAGARYYVEALHADGTRSGAWVDGAAVSP